MRNKAFKIVVALMALVMSISSIVTGSGSGIKATKDGTCDIGFFADFLAETRKSEKTTIELHGEGLPFNSLIAPSDEGAIS